MTQERSVERVEEQLMFLQRHVEALDEVIRSLDDRVARLEESVRSMRDEQRDLRVRFTEAMGSDQEEEV